MAPTMSGMPRRPLLHAHWSVLIGLVVVALAQAAPPAQPTTRPADDKPAAPQVTETRGLRVVRGGAVSDELDRILERLETKGRAIKGLGCDIAYRFVTVSPVEDVQTKEGTLLFARAEPNSHFLVHFNKKIAAGVIERHGEYFAFDGQWLSERNDKSRNVIRTQIVREGEKVNPFELGKGPFPLPFGQKKDEILRRFKVSLKSFELGDPRNTHHLHCIPLPGTELARKYSRVEIYVDKEIELPVRIVSERISDDNRIEVDFKNIDLDEAPAMSRFEIEVPEGYEVRREPLPPVDPAS